MNCADLGDRYRLEGRSGKKEKELKQVKVKIKGTASKNNPDTDRWRRRARVVFASERSERAAPTLTTVTGSSKDVKVKSRRKEIKGSTVVTWRLTKEEKI